MRPRLRSLLALLACLGAALPPAGAATAAPAADDDLLKLAFQPLPDFPAAPPPPAPKPFAIVRRNATAIALQSFLIPRDAATLPPFLRVGFLDAAGRATELAGTTTLATREAMVGKADTVVRIVLGAAAAAAEEEAASPPQPPDAAAPTGEVGSPGALARLPALEVDLYLDPEGARHRSWEGKEQGLPRLEVVWPGEAPSSLMNAPVVLNQDGKLARPAEEKPKTLLQRYVPTTAKATQRDLD